MIVLPNGLDPQEIRVLQEFRRLGKETLTVELINAIRHPTGGGEAPAVTLVEKGYLTRDTEGFAVTQKGKDFLAIDAKPLVPERSASAASGAGNPKAGGS